MRTLIRFSPLLLVLLTTACASLGLGNSKGAVVSGAKVEADTKKAPNLSKQRLMLSQGYSILYEDASNVDLIGLILYVKTESDDFNKLITAVSEHGGRLKKNLEKIAKDYPGVRIDLDPLPEMEKRKRMAVGKDRALRFAPVVGIGGVEYERTMLISMSNALNHESHLCKVMAEEEPDPGLKKFLLDTEKQYAGLYERVMSLLDRKYFKSNTLKPTTSKKAAPSKPEASSVPAKKAH